MEMGKSEDKPPHSGNEGPGIIRIPGSLIIVLMLICLIFLIVKNYERFDKDRTLWKAKEIIYPSDVLYEKCTGNMKNVSTALEMYCCNNGGEYPDSLSRLTPDYLKTIPTCPSAKKDTYSETYRINRKERFYHFSCGGNNHRNKGLPSNFPRFNSNSCLTYYTGEMDDFIRRYEINNVDIALNNNPSVLKDRFVNDNTPLHIAAYYFFNEAIELFLKNGADINATNDQGQTPLHIATYMGHYETAKLLLEKGAKRDIRDKKGKTPLDIAEEEKYEDIVTLLKGK